jgi:hypothetical protein
LAATFVSRIATLLTDFGLADAYVGVMKGVMLGIAPGVTLVDLCHEVPPQDVRAGAFLLMTSFAYFPPDTVHLAVVDPGVGTARKIVAVQAGSQYFVGPDNGLLRWAVERAGGPAQVVTVENPAFRLATVSTTFHARDVMAPAAAHLANGVPLPELGPPLAHLEGEAFPQPERRGRTLAGRVIYVDRYGNCITNLPVPAPGGPAPRGSGPRLEVVGQSLPLVPTYGQGALGQAIAVTDSAGFVEIALRNGSAAQQLGIRVDTPVVLYD